MKVTESLIDEYDAFICPWRNMKGPNSQMTLHWMDMLQDFLADKPVILHDHGPEFKAFNVHEEAQYRGINWYCMVPRSAAYVNPCEEFHYEIERRYQNEEKRNHKESLRAIIKAYYTPTKKHITNYWAHCLLTTGRPSRYLVNKLVHEGSEIVPKHQKVLEECERTYHRFQRNLRV